MVGHVVETQVGIATTLPAMPRPPSNATMLFVAFVALAVVLAARALRGERTRAARLRFLQSP